MTKVNTVLINIYFFIDSIVGICFLHATHCGEIQITHTNTHAHTQTAKIILGPSVYITVTQIYAVIVYFI